MAVVDTAAVAPAVVVEVVVDVPPPAMAPAVATVSEIASLVGPSATAHAARPSAAVETAVVAVDVA